MLGLSPSFKEHVCLFDLEFGLFGFLSNVNKFWWLLVAGQKLLFCKKKVRVITKIRLWKKVTHTLVKNLAQTLFLVEAWSIQHVIFQVGFYCQD